MGSRLAIGVVAALTVVLGGCSTPPPEQTRDQAISNTLWELAVSAEKSHDYASAIGQYHQVYEREPTNIPALLGVARNMRYAGNPKEAIKELKVAILKLGDKPELLLELGKAQLAAAIVTDARETLEKYAEASRRDWQAHAVLAIVYDRLGRHEEAQKKYDEALRLSPGNVSVINNLALSYAISGDLGPAISVLKKLVDGENATPQTRQNLALLYAMQGELETAERLAAEDLTPEQVARNVAAFRILRGDPVSRAKAAPVSSKKETERAETPAKK